MKVIVGLGNPGAKYAGTRHNVGFAVVEYLAAAPGVSPFRSQFSSLVAETTEAGEKVLLLKPETFMNLSGRAVRAALDFYKVPVENLLVVSDDFNLPLGKLRARAGGSHGGQNGLRNIQEQLGTAEYPRLRIGVGQPEPGEAVDFVLSKFKPGEKAAVEEAVANAAAAVLVWLRQGMPACMNRANGPADPPKKKPKPDTPPKKPKDEGRRTKDEADDSVAPRPE